MLPSPSPGLLANPAGGFGDRFEKMWSVDHSFCSQGDFCRSFFGKTPGMNIWLTFLGECIFYKNFVELFLG